MARGAWLAVAIGVGVGAGCPQPVPPAPPPLPPPLDPEALLAETAGETALAALSLVRFASLVGVFIEDSADLYGELPPEEAANYHAEHALGLLAGCPAATVLHEPDSPDVLVEFGPDCFAANTGAHLEGRLQLSVLDDGATILGGGFGRVARLVFAGAVVDGLELSGTVDSGVVGMVSAGGVGPFGVVALGSFNLDSNVAILISMGQGIFLSPVDDDEVAIDERQCRLRARGFEVEQLTTDANACAVTEGTLTAAWLFACADGSAPGELFDVEVEAQLPLDTTGPVDVELTIDGEPFGTYAVEVAQLPVDARCL